jgi:hypothetical protein
LNQFGTWVALSRAYVGHNMARRHVEKVYGERTLQERADGYIQMNIPKQAVDDPRVGLEAGQQVRVRAIIEEGHTFLKIEAVADE